MKPWRSKLLLLGGVAVLGIAIPAFSQNAQEQILPPGFENATPVPPAQEEPSENEAQPGDVQPSGSRPRASGPAQPRDAFTLDDFLADASEEELEALLAGVP